MIIVLVARIRCFERVGTSLNIQHVFSNFTSARFVYPWALINTISGVKPYFFLRNIAGAIVDGIYISIGLSVLSGVVKPRVDKDIA